MKKNKFYLIVIYILLSITLAEAQVTIGSNGIPLQGALLQLKENENLGANASKGLLLPRVSLIDPYSVEVLSGAVQTDASEYIGTTIYNATETDNACATITKGLFVWNGSSWVGLGNGKIIEKHQVIYKLIYKY